MRYLITIISFFLMISLQAQTVEKQVISSTGNDVSAGTYQLSQTVGESMVETYTSGSFILGQGFQQVEEVIEDTTITIKELDLVVDYTLYPNPTNDVINLELELKNYSANIFIELVDIQGRLIDQKQVDLESNNMMKTQFSLKGESSGIYFLKIRDNTSKLSTSLEINKY